MSKNSGSFADLLEELIERARDESPPPLNPSIHADLLGVAAEPAPSATCGEIERQYSELAERQRIEEEAVSLLGRIELRAERTIAAPSIEPDEIALELGIAGQTRVADLDRIRREFAFRNHPDRLPPEHRERAMVRMQIANRMIDDAKRVARR